MKLTYSEKPYLQAEQDYELNDSLVLFIQMCSRISLRGILKKEIVDRPVTRL
jgi:hypothetical protein